MFLNKNKNNTTAQFVILAIQEAELKRTAV
jgi:hypothetical protein